MCNKLGKYPQFQEKKEEGVGCAVMLCARNRETGWQYWQIGQAYSRRITPLHLKTAISKKLLLPRRRLLQYSSLFMAPAGIMQYWFHLDALPPFFPVNFPCFAKEMFFSRSRQDRNPNS